MKPKDKAACTLCGDVDRALFLRARCHPSAPLRAIKEGDVLVLRCYVPDCDREVVRLDLAGATLTETRPARRSMKRAAADIAPKSVPEAGAAAYSGFSVHYLRKARRGLCDGPPYVKAGWTVRYLIADLDSWLASHRVVSRELGRART